MGIDSFNDSLVVMPAREAIRLARLNGARESSNTWGEFVSAIASDEVSIDELSRKFDEMPVGEPFDPDDIYGFAEGDWPAWPMHKMLGWLPESVQKLGTVGAAAISGEILQIDPNLLDGVIEALATEGVECEVDQFGYVAAACGAWRYS